MMNDQPLVKNDVTDLQELVRSRCLRLLPKLGPGLRVEGGTRTLIGAKARLRATIGEDLAALPEPSVDALISAALRVGIEFLRFDFAQGDADIYPRIESQADTWAGEDLDFLLKSLKSSIPRIARRPLTAEQCEEAYVVAAMIATVYERHEHHQTLNE